MNRILGIVEYSHSPTGSKRPEWCRVKPIYREAGGSWNVIEQRELDFPQEGLLFWYNPPHEALVNTCWVATPKELQVNPKSGERKKDQFGIQAADPLDQFIELRGDPSRLEIRRLLAHGGITLASRPVGRVLVELPGEGSKWVGPYALEFKRNANNRFEASATNDLAFMQVRSVEPNLLQELMIDGHAVLCLRPNENIGGVVEWFNTQTDSQLLETMLKKLRRFDSAAANALGATKDVFKSYVASLREASLTDVQRQDEKARAEALEVLFENLDKSEALVNETIESITNHPKIATGIEAMIDRLAEEKKPEIESRVLQSLSDIDKELREKEAKQTALASDLSELDQEIKSKKRLLQIEKQKSQKLRSELESDLNEVVKRILEKPVLELGNSVIFDALADKAGERVAKAAAKSIPLELKAASTELETLDQAVGALASATVTNGLTVDVLLSALAGVISGKQLVVVGESTEQLLSFISDIFAGGQSAQVYLPTNIFGLDDLFDLPISPLGNSEYGPTKLVDFVRAAEMGSHAYVLCFKGVNRAPLETAFFDFSNSIRQQGPVSLPLRDKGGEPYLLEVGQKAIFVCTLASGPTVFKPIDQFWSHSVLLDSTRFDREQVAISEISASVSFSSLLEWRKEIGPIVGVNLSALEEAFGVDTKFRNELAIYFAVFRAFGGRDKAVAEWLYSRKAATHSENMLLELAEKFSEGAKQQLESIIELGGYERLKLAKGTV